MTGLGRFRAAAAAEAAVVDLSAVPSSSDSSSAAPTAPAPAASGALAPEPAAAASGLAAAAPMPSDPPPPVDSSDDEEDLRLHALRVEREREAAREGAAAATATAAPANATYAAASAGASAVTAGTNTEIAVSKGKDTAAEKSGEEKVSAEEASSAGPGEKIESKPAATPQQQPKQSEPQPKQADTSMLPQTPSSRKSTGVASNSPADDGSSSVSHRTPTGTSHRTPTSIKETPHTGRWKATITYGGQLRTIGMFGTKAEASVARRAVGRLLGGGGGGDAGLGLGEEDAAVAFDVAREEALIAVAVFLSRRGSPSASTFAAAAAAGSSTPTSAGGAKQGTAGTSTRPSSAPSSSTKRKRGGVGAKAAGKKAAAASDIISVSSISKSSRSSSWASSSKTNSTTPKKRRKRVLADVEEIGSSSDDDSDDDAGGNQNDGGANPSPTRYGDEVDSAKNVTWIISTDRDIGDRVFASWSVNNMFYWGYVIAQVEPAPDGKTAKKYSVLFEDGAISHDLTKDRICTEVNYVQMLKKNPSLPNPDKEFRQTLKTHLAHGRAERAAAAARIAAKKKKGSRTAATAAAADAAAATPLRKATSKCNETPDNGKGEGQGTPKKCNASTAPTFFASFNQLNDAEQNVVNQVFSTLSRLRTQTLLRVDTLAIASSIRNELEGSFSITSVDRSVTLAQEIIDSLKESTEDG